MERVTVLYPQDEVNLNILSHWLKNQAGSQRNSNFHRDIHRNLWAFFRNDWTKNSVTIIVVWAHCDLVQSQDLASTCPVGSPSLKLTLWLDALIIWTLILFSSPPTCQIAWSSYWILQWLWENKCNLRARSVRNWQSSMDLLRLCCPSIDKGQMVTDLWEQHNI